MRGKGIRYRTKKSVIRAFNTHFKVGRENECWIWVGWKDRWGYGYFSVGKVWYGKSKSITASRFALELKLGRALKPKMCALHDCPGGDNPSCVNPNHLWEGTKSDNMFDKCNKGRARGGSMKGSENPFSLLTEKQVKVIKRRYKKRSKDNNQYTLAKEFGVTQSLIHLITSGKAWVHVR